MSRIMLRNICIKKLNTYMFSGGIYIEINRKRIKIIRTRIKIIIHLISKTFLHQCKYCELKHHWASLIAQLLKIQHEVQKTLVGFLD